MRLPLTILLGFLSSFFLFSCEREKELKNLEIRETPAHCHNKIYDGEEMAWDCGGPCKDCENKTPSCDPSNNEARYYDGTNTYYDTYSVDLVSCHLSISDSDNFKVLSTFNGDTLKIYPQYVATHVSQSVECDFNNNISSESEAYYGGKEVCGASIFMEVKNDRRYVTLCNGIIKNTGFNTKDDTLFYAKIACGN